MTKSTGSVTSAIGNRNASTNGTHSYGSSLLCYQNVSPPSPTSSAGFNTNSSIVAAVEPLTKNDDLKPDGTTTAGTLAGTLAGLTISDTTTLPVAIKKRNKLRHRFSDVGSWGRKKKDRAHKYRSMNIESLEVLGDPVIEDEFFVSNFLIASEFCILNVNCYLTRVIWVLFYRRWNAHISSIFLLLHWVLNHTLLCSFHSSGDLFWILVVRSSAQRFTAITLKIVSHYSWIILCRCVAPHSLSFLEYLFKMIPDLVLFHQICRWYGNRAIKMIK